MPAPHRFDPTILREYDIRGVIGRTLGEPDAEAIGAAFGTLLHRRRPGTGTVAVGYDGRLSSPALEAALVRGLASTGVRVRRIGLGPTPMLYYAAVMLEADGGVMVTGSHNPPDFNGFKMVMTGAPFYGADIQALAAVAAAGDYIDGDGAITEVAIRDGYVARLLRDYAGGRELAVAWDAGNGATGDVLARLTAALPGRHVLLNATIDGTFPAHHPDPTDPHTLAQLIATVAAEKLDLGIAFDGDGDRIGVVDGGGRILWGDQLMMLYAADVLARHPGATIIADCKASETLFGEIARLGGKPLMWRTGHSLIKTKMAETGAPLAGEMSGHIFFKDGYYGYDNALYAAVRLLALLARSHLSLSALHDRMPQSFTTPELRFPCADTRKFAVIDEVKARLTAAGARVNDVDGVRVTTDDGWWLLRASNTQDVLVARCESRDMAGLDRLKAVLAGQLRASGIELPK